MGSGPALLLLHGAGAGSFSWRALAPLLADRFRLVMPDLPGHAFSSPITNAKPTIERVSSALGDLLRKLDVQPELAVGHSAGAAIALRMTLDGWMAPRSIASLNGALRPPNGLAGLIFSPAAKLLAMSSMAPRLFAHRASDPDAIRRLLDATGSKLDASGIALYHRVVSSSAHVSGVLAMMANWDLSSFREDLRRLQPPLFLIVGENDRTVDPRDADYVRSLSRNARVLLLPGVGHLAHEEQPASVAEALVDIAFAHS